MRRRLLATSLGCVMLASLASACESGETTLYASFPDVGDLVAHHAVQIADVRVGEVGSISMTPTYRAFVQMRLRPGIRVPADSIAIVRTTSLLGEKFIELQPGSADSARTGPFLHDGDEVGRGIVAPDLESVAQDAIGVLGAVRAGDVATLVDTGARAFGPRTKELRSLIADLARVNATLAGHTKGVGGAVDHLGAAAATLAKSADQLRALLGNLAGTTTVLADNRGRVVGALSQIDRLARSLNVVLDPNFERIDTQLRQINGVVQELAGSQTEVDSLVRWLETWFTGLPKTIPGDWTQVYLWIVPEALDVHRGQK